VSDVRSAGFALDVQPEVFYNYRQFPLFEPSFVIRTTGGDPAALGPSVRAEIEGVSRSAVVTRMRTLDEIANESIADPRRRATVAAMFSIAALLLGMLGMYGLMSYNVMQQIREIGIRMALGAGRAQVGTMIAGRAFGLTAIGVALGLALAYVAARSLSTLFFRVSPADPMIVVAACLLLIVSAGVATLLPARLAISVEPADALRHE
jgi:putative ABC transport system permease protein